MPSALSLLRVVLAFLLTISHAFAAFHPADTDESSSLSIDEITSYAAAWKTQTAWPAGPSPISDAYYQQAVHIWKNGETYRDAGIAAAPYNWVPNPADGSTYLPGPPLSAIPFDLITVSDIDPSLDLEITFTIAGSPGIFQTLWNPSDTPNAIEILIPLNPYTLSGDGVVNISIQVPASATSSILPALQLLPLPAAPGATATALASLNSDIAAKSINYGHTLSSEDVANFSSIPQSAKAIAYMNAWLNNPDNPGSLANTISGMDAAELDLTDRIFGRLQLKQDDNNLLSLSSLKHASKAALHSKSKTTPRISADGNDYLSIENAAELSQAMADQATAETAVKDKISAKDGANDLLNLQSNIVAAKDALLRFKGVKPPAGGGGVLAAVSVTLMVSDFLDHFDAGNLPSHFTDLELSIDGPDRGYFLEDATGCETATVIAKVSAASEGFDMLKTLGQVAPAGVLGKPGIKDGFRWADEAFPSLDQMDLQPYEWTGIDIGGDLYSNATSDSKFNVTSYNDAKVGMNFEPAEVGVGIITVTASSQKFSGNAIERDIQYQTAPIVVKFVNPTLTVSGEETFVTYQATFTDAAQIGASNIEWTVSAGNIASKRTLGEGVYEIDWTPPVDSDLYPVSMTAKYTSSQCLQGLPGAPERKDSININSDVWEIIPATNCVSQGESILFEITGAIDVDWSVTSGSGTIHPVSGLFTAGSEKGEVTVRATPSDSENDFKETSFYVGCDLIVAWELSTDDAPDTPKTVHPTVSGFLISVGSEIEVDAVNSDIFVTYQTITPPAEGELLGSASGSFAGAGLFYSHDPAVNAALVDNSNATKLYAGTGEFGEPYEYTVEAGFSASDFEETGRSVNLLGGPDGTMMELQLDAGVSSSAAVDNPTLTYNWFFSNGTQAAGEIVTPSFARNTSRFTAQLQVVDAHGNAATYIESFIIVEVYGEFQLSYSPDKRQAICLVTGFSIPPSETEGSIIEFTTDPDRCKLSLFLDGGRDASISTTSGSTGIPADADPPAYYIGFGGSQL